MDRSAGSNRRAIAAPLIISLGMVFLFVWLFSAALHQPQPHELPIGFVGPAMALPSVEAGLEANAPGAFRLSTFASADEARTAIREREIVGAAVVGSGDPVIMVAGAAGKAPSAAVSGALTAVAQALGKTATVEDVQPQPASDSRGLVPFFLVMGVSISAFLFQVFSRSMDGAVPSAQGDRVSASSSRFSTGSWLLLPCRSCWDSTAATGCSRACARFLALAVASATAAFHSLFGKAGIGVAGIILILLGNASSGSVLGAAFLPQPFRWLSPILPAGAGLEVARSTLYFEGAGYGWSLGVLALWVAGSFVVLACVAAVRNRAKPCG